MFVSGPDDTITCDAARAGRPEPSAAAMASSSAPAVIKNVRQRTYLEAIKLPMLPQLLNGSSSSCRSGSQNPPARAGDVFPRGPLLLVPPRLLVPRAVCAKDGRLSSERVLFRRIG